MARKTDDSQIRSYVEQGDQCIADGNWSSAYSAYNSAYTQAAQMYGYLAPELLPILEKLVDSVLKNSDSDGYLKYVAKWLRSILVIKERQHGLDSKELVPILTQLVQFYDYDGAHMLAIEVKQRIDDIEERASALRNS